MTIRFSPHRQGFAHTLETEDVVLLRGSPTYVATVAGAIRVESYIWSNVANNSMRATSVHLRGQRIKRRALVRAVPDAVAR